MNPAEAQTLLRPYLLPGERLVWSGRPKRGIVFKLDNLVLVPLGLAWMGMAVLGAVDALATWRGDIFVGAWSIVALAVGFYLVAGRFLAEAWLRNRLFYAVTNRRLLILRTGLMPRLRSIEIGFLPVFEYEEHRDGRGSLSFDIDDDEGSPWWLGTRRQVALSPHVLRFRFDRIEQPRFVYDLICREVDRWRREQYGETSEARSFIG